MVPIKLTTPVRSSDWGDSKAELSPSNGDTKTPRGLRRPFLILD